MSEYLEQVVSLGDDASKMLFEACKATWANRDGKYGEVIADEEQFRGARHWGITHLLDVPKPRGLIFDQQADGIGTKVLVSQRTSRYDSAASDLIAMASDDAAIRGLEPIHATTVLDVNRLDGEKHQGFMQELALGAVVAANKARIALYGGETAVLGDIIEGYGAPINNLHFSWSATVHAVGHSRRFVDGSEVRPGMTVVGLKESGLRSNAISLVRNTLKKAFGNSWHRTSFEDGMTLGDTVRQGSEIYSSVFTDAIGGYDLSNKGKAKVEGAAHITGGGITKLAELLDVSGYGADIDAPLVPPEIMKYVLRLAGIQDEDAYKMMHMGQGAIAISSQPDKLIKVAAKNGVEAQVIGEVTKKSRIKLRSQGESSTGKKLIYKD